MAVLVYMEQTAQDETTVSYRYGPSPEDLRHSLVIDKASMGPVGPTVRDDLRVAGWLGFQHRKLGRWLERSMLAS